MKRENHFNHPHHRINHNRQEIADAIAKAQTTTALLPEQPSPIPHKDTFCADIYGCATPKQDCLYEQKCIHRCYRG